MLLCNEINCKADDCKNEIDLLYHEIITKLHTAANETFKMRHNEYKSGAKPGSNDYVKEFHSLAWETYMVWHSAGNCGKVPYLKQKEEHDDNSNTH